MSRTPFSCSPHRGGTFRPQLEALEDRLTPGGLSGAAPPALGPALVDCWSHGATRTTSPVVDFATRSIVFGESTLTRTDHGVSIRLTTSGLPPGAYTAWWVVVNNPDTAPGTRTVGRAAGHVVGQSGNATFAAHLKEGEILQGHPTLSGGSLQDARRAEIRMVIRYHGPVDPRRVHEQTHTFEPDRARDVLITIHRAP